MINRIPVEIEGFGYFEFTVPDEIILGRIDALSKLIFPDNIENHQGLQLIVTMLTIFVFLMIDAPNDFHLEDYDPVNNQEDFDMFCTIFSSFLSALKAYKEVMNKPFDYQLPSHLH